MNMQSVTDISTAVDFFAFAVVVIVAKLVYAMCACVLCLVE